LSPTPTPPRRRGAAARWFRLWILIVESPLTPEGGTSQRDR